MRRVTMQKSRHLDGFFCLFQSLDSFFLHSWLKKNIQTIQNDKEQTQKLIFKKVSL